MTNHFSTTRNVKLLSCLSLVALLAACGEPGRGYYDANGNWVSTSTVRKPHAPLPGGPGPHKPGPHKYESRSDYNDYDSYRYTRRGYYDSNGYYIARDGGLTAPVDMFPPRGMCRVWFVSRTDADQPDVESCDGIRSRVPAGAYVIYGG